MTTKTMKRVENLAKHLVGKINVDNTKFVIQIKGFSTEITANPDGTLNIKHFPKAS